jgi:hypothetical protein
LSTKIPVTHFLTEMCTRNPSRNFVQDLQILHGNVRNSGIPIPGGVPPQESRNRGGYPPRKGGGTPPNLGGVPPLEMPNSGLGGGTPPISWSRGGYPPRNPGEGGVPPRNPESTKKVKKMQKNAEISRQGPPRTPGKCKKMHFFSSPTGKQPRGKGEKK